MYKFSKSIFLLLVTIPLLTGCPPPPPPPGYDLNVLMNPTDAGSVAPDGGTYEDGTSVTIRATANGNWQFENWSGDISSTDNPLSLTMDDDYTITANFKSDDPPPTFTAKIPITNGVHSRTITLVSEDDGTVQNGLDSNDLEGPPVAPPGAFFTGFVVDGMHLYKDVRPAAGNIVWELRLHRASRETITLEDWTISKSDLKGSLMLVDNPDDSTPNIEIDMQSTSSYTVSDPSIQSLFVVYTAPEPAKMITDFDGQQIEQLNNIEADPMRDEKSSDKAGIKITKDNNRN